MHSEFKKNFVLSVGLHVAVLTMVCFVTAFVPTPRIDTPIFMEIVGGGGGPEPESGPPKLAEPVRPPLPQPKVEQPQPEEKEPPKPEPARIVQPKRPEMVIPKETPKKKTPEKPKEVKKEEPKKEQAKKAEPSKKETKSKIPTDAKVVKKSDFFKQNEQPKQFAKLDPRLSREAIRNRFDKAVGSVKVGVPPGGSGPGMGPGSASAYGDYGGILQGILRDAFTAPGQVTPNQSVDVVVHVTRDGSLSFVRITRRSGNPLLDESAIEAIRKVPRVPPLPAALGNACDFGLTFQKVEG